MTEPRGDDPTLHSRWRPLRLLQASMDADIARIYDEQRIEGLKTTWVMELLRLHARGPMTITELAESVQRTHSALSQKVAAMRAAGWVETAGGEDGRTKRVALTDRARAVTALLAAEWRATEAALADLEAEVPYPLSQAVADLERALERRSFHDRIAEKLAQDPEGGRNTEGAGDTRNAAGAGPMEDAKEAKDARTAGSPGNGEDAGTAGSPANAQDTEGAGTAE